MAFEDDFDELEKMLLAKSTDYEGMRIKLKAIRQLKNFAEMMSPAQESLYASISRSHRKVLGHLDVADTKAATREAAKAIAWFYFRFRGTDPSALNRSPQLAEELREVRKLAEQSELLREAISKTTGQEIHDA